MRRVTNVLLLFLAVTNAVDIKLTIDDRVLRSLDTTQFLSFTLDTSFIRGNFCGINWLKAILLARSLTPCYVRVGGDDSDFMVFDESDQFRAFKRHKETTKDVREPKPDANGCAMFDHVEFNVTRTQFDRINWFAQSSGLKLMFDLNAIYGRTNGTKWTPTNTVKLLNYASEMEYDMDFELGNEPDDYIFWYHFTITGQEMVKNYKLMRSILNSFPSYRKSKLIGPAVGSPFSREYKEFLEGGALDYIDAVTFHHYYGPGEGQNLSFFLSPKVMDTLTPVLQRAVSLVKRHSRSNRKQVWLGETASCYNGGTANISNTYAAGFMWMDKLGLCALHGIDAVFRHTFFMGNYAMTDDETNPNPDYWLSLLYRTLVGTQVYAVTSNLEGEAAKFFRFYAQNNQTHTILFGMNLLNETAEVQINGQTGPATQYLLEPKDNVLTAKHVLLNGRELIFDGVHSPSLANTGVSVSQPIKIPSHRYGMWVWTK